LSRNLKSSSVSFTLTWTVHFISLISKISYCDNAGESEGMWLLVGRVDGKNQVVRGPVYSHAPGGVSAGGPHTRQAELSGPSTLHFLLIENGSVMM
jgi:hypothetical protein